MPAKEIHSEWAKTLAEQLVASGDTPPAELSDDERLALAWALKDLAIAAWSTDQTLVPLASTTLATLLSAANSETKNASNREISAVSDWVAGMADITCGRMSDATRHLEQAEAEFRALGFASPAAHTRVPKIIALFTLGLHADAAECGARAYEELLGLGELHAASKVSLNLGQMCFHRNEFASAQEHFHKAAKLFTDAGDFERSAMAEMSIADALASTGDFDAALHAYARSKSLVEHGKFPILDALIEESVALVQLARGTYREALNGLEKSRRSYEVLGMPQHLATAEKQLADAYLSLRLLTEALALYGQALRRFESLEMPLEQAWAQTQRGRTLAALGYPIEEVSESFLFASSLFSSQGVSAGTATVLLARAELALSHDDAELARELAGNAANIFKGIGMVADRAQADVIRAHALLAGEKIAEAVVLFAATLDQASELQLLSTQVRCHIGLGLALRKRGETQAAKLAFESAIESFEEQREALAGDDLRHAFLVDHLRP